MLPRRRYDGCVLIAPKACAGYFASYRKTYPEQKFGVYSLEEVEASFRFDVRPDALDWLMKKEPNFDAKLLLSILSCMRESSYRDPSLLALIPLRDAMLEEGLLIRKEVEPAAIFCGKPLIARGYYSGIRLSYALQDLPNISLNWDLGQPIFRDEELPLQAVSMDEVYALIKEEARRREVAMNDIVLISDGAVNLPGVQTLSEPFIPEGRYGVYLRQEHGLLLPEDILPARAYQELRLPTSSMLKKWRDYDVSRLLKHPNLLLAFDLRS